MAGDSGNAKLLAQPRNLLAIQKTRHKPELFVHLRTFIPWHKLIFLVPKTVKYVSGSTGGLQQFSPFSFKYKPLAQKSTADLVKVFLKWSLTFKFTQNRETLTISTDFGNPPYGHSAYFIKMSCVNWWSTVSLSLLNQGLASRLPAPDKPNLKFHGSGYNHWRFFSASCG